MWSKNVFLFVSLGLSQCSRKVIGNTLFLKAASESCLTPVHGARKSVMSSDDERTPMWHSLSVAKTVITPDSGRASPSQEVPSMATFRHQQLLVHPSNLKRYCYYLDIVNYKHNNTRYPQIIREYNNTARRGGGGVMLVYAVHSGPLIIYP